MRKMTSELWCHSSGSFSQAWLPVVLRAAVFELEFHTDCSRHLEASQRTREGGTRREKEREGDRERKREREGRRVLRSTAGILFDR